MAAVNFNCVIIQTEARGKRYSTARFSFVFFSIVQISIFTFNHLINLIFEIYRVENTGVLSSVLRHFTRFLFVHKISA